MSWFRPKPDESALADLVTAVGGLRTAVADLRTLVVDQGTEISRLQNERALRETEMADLRTRYETLIRRIGARLDRTEKPETETDSPLTVRRRIRGY